MAVPGCQHPCAPVSVRAAGAARRRRQAAFGLTAAGGSGAATGSKPDGNRRQASGGTPPAAVSLNFLRVHPDPFVPPSDRRPVEGLPQCIDTMRRRLERRPALRAGARP